MKATSVVHALLLGLLLTGTAPAFAVFKCEAGGKIVYADEPCVGGVVLEIDRTVPLDAAKAKKLAIQERKQLIRLEGEQRKEQAKKELERRQAVKARAAKQKKCTTLVRRKKRAEEDVAYASGKSAAKIKRRAQRAAEDYIAECGDPHSRGLSVAR